ncbi:cold shock CspA family protein [Sinobacterium caligoides]|uniref:Cold shock CspA family protein n=1 Tax=Sinobacterium caligoides TaxID=933926 RepID=A0A3N2DZR3_9GAMM|nr:cold shock CspA family protein [Sinobacterium caligoides]
MAVIYRLLISLAVAIPVSGFFAGYTDTAPGSFTLDTTTALAFIVAAALSAILAGMVSDGNSTTSSPSRSHRTPSQAGDEDDDFDEPITGERHSGSVKWFNSNKGFGFITSDDGTDVFVHYRAIRAKGRRRLQEGQQVEFSVVDGDKGPQARDVVILDE